MHRGVNLEPQFQTLLLKRHVSEEGNVEPYVSVSCRYDHVLRDEEIQAL